MLVRSLIYGWGFDFMRPFQKEEPPKGGSFFGYVMRESNNLNAMRMSIAGESFVEPNIYFCQRQKCKRFPSPPPIKAAADWRSFLLVKAVMFTKNHPATGSSSGVAKAADRAAMVDEMIAACRKAWDERHAK